MRSHTINHFCVTVMFDYHLLPIVLFLVLFAASADAATKPGMGAIGLFGVVVFGGAFVVSAYDLLALTMSW